MVSSGMGEVSASRRSCVRDHEPKLTRDGLVALAEFVDDVAPAARESGWPSTAYRVSKIAMNAYVRVLARELGDRRIIINAVCPGGCAPRWVATAPAAASRKARRQSSGRRRASASRPAASSATGAASTGDRSRASACGRRPEAARDDEPLDGAEQRLQAERQHGGRDRALEDQPKSSRRMPVRIGWP